MAIGKIVITYSNLNLYKIKLEILFISFFRRRMPPLYAYYLAHCFLPIACLI